MGLNAVSKAIFLPRSAFAHACAHDRIRQLGRLPETQQSHINDMTVYDACLFIFSEVGN